MSLKYRLFVPRLRPGPPSAERRAWSAEALVLATAGWLALVANRPFVQAMERAAGFDGVSALAWSAALVALLVAVNFLLLLPLCVGRATRVVLTLALVVAAVCTYYVTHMGVHLDPTMLRNVLRTNWAETRELLTPSLAWTIAWQAVLPAAVLWSVARQRPTWGRALRRRVLAWAGMAALALALLLAIFQPLASTMRQNKDLRYLITPAAALWSAGRVVAQDARGAVQPRLAIGLDAQPGPRMAGATRPRLVVMVVGETARAANWGLNGYARQTTPELAALPVINFSKATACGTNTEVSVPCMFAPVGRRQYDEDRIRGSQSLLHVAARAGVRVTWRDNQSGCKGVCEGLPTEQTADFAPAGLCRDGHCLDEALLHGLDDRLARVQGTELLVLHMLGNHGPSYFRRYPPAFERFRPACRRDDLQACRSEEIVNAYDNALLYTDHVLAKLIRRLQARADTLDSAVIYASDHGESLGERGLYLHGMPYAIAPAVQAEIPMVMWLSPGFARQQSLDLACLRARAGQPVAHDHLFHTVLGLMDVKTTLYERSWDFTAECRGPVTVATPPAAADPSLKAGPP